MSDHHDPRVGAAAAATSETLKGGLKRAREGGKAPADAAADAKAAQNQPAGAEAASQTLREGLGEAKP